MLLCHAPLTGDVVEYLTDFCVFLNIKTMI